MLLGAFSFFSNDLAIDLGTANTCVFARGAGIVLNEPSIVAMNNVNDQIEAVGSEAKEMLGRTPGSITAIRPMRDGVIADFDAAEKMLGYFIKKAHGRSASSAPASSSACRPEITQVERRAVKDSAYRAKASEVHLVEEGMAAAIGAGLPITEACGQHDRRHRRRHHRHRRHLARRHRLQQVGARRRQRDGRSHHPVREARARPAHRRADGGDGSRSSSGSAAPLFPPKEMEVKGRHVLEGKPTTIILNDQEVREALAEPVRQIIQAVRDALERIPPELSADVCDRGHRPERRRRAPAEPGRASAGGNGLARSGRRGPAVVGRARRRQDAVGLQPAAERSRSTDR